MVALKVVGEVAKHETMDLQAIFITIYMPQFWILVEDVVENCGWNKISATTTQPRLQLLFKELKFGCRYN